jgi:hypothetical protein
VWKGRINYFRNDVYSNKRRNRVGVTSAQQHLTSALKWALTQPVAQLDAPGPVAAAADPVATPVATPVVAKRAFVSGFGATASPELRKLYEQCLERFGSRNQLASFATTNKISGLEESNLRHRLSRIKTGKRLKKATQEELTVILTRALDWTDGNLEVSVPPREQPLVHAQAGQVETVSGDDRPVRRSFLDRVLGAFGLQRKGQ